MLGFGIKHRRQKRLEVEGQTIRRAALLSGVDPDRPTRLIRINLGYGPEVWAHFAETPHFDKTTRVLQDGLFVSDIEDPQGLADALNVPLVGMSVKF